MLAKQPLENKLSFIHSFIHSYSFISLYDTPQQTTIQATLMMMKLPILPCAEKLKS